MAENKTTNKDSENQRNNGKNMKYNKVFFHHFKEKREQLALRRKNCKVHTQREL